MNLISTLVSVTPDRSLTPLPCEEMAIRQPSMKKEVGSDQPSNLPAPDLGSECEK